MVVGSLFFDGARTGTKSKREQSATLDPTRYPEVAKILTQLLAVLEMDDYLVPYSYQTFLEALSGVSQHYRIQAHVTPHSARAGFATERIAAGEDPTTVRLAGRWESEFSFKTYIDVFMASQVTIMLSLSGHKEIIEYTFLHLHLYFSEVIFLSERHAPARHNKVPAHRQICAPSTGLLGRDQASQGQEAARRLSKSAARRTPAAARRLPAASGIADSSAGIGAAKGQSKGDGIGSSLLRKPRQR